VAKRCLNGYTVGWQVSVVSASQECVEGYMEICYGTLWDRYHIKDKRARVSHLGETIGPFGQILTILIIS